jgi:regulator of protease activity HflC (stomatin/prohibitin superfamily)
MLSLISSTSATSTKISGSPSRLRVEEAVAAAVAVQPVLHVGPAADVVHRLVLDQLLDQRRGRVPADAAQLQEADVEPGGEHVLHLDVQRAQAPVGLQVRLQVGAQVDQEADAFAVGAEALQQRVRGDTVARRYSTSAAAWSGVPSAAAYCACAFFTFSGRP